MTELPFGRDLTLVEDFDDIESELLCSDREASLGVFLSSDEKSPQSMVDLARPGPWSEGGKPA